MKAAQLAPHGRIQFPAIHVFGTHRRLTGLVGLAVIGSLAVVGTTAISVPGPAAFNPRPVVPAEVPLAKIFDASEVAAIAATRALVTARQSDRTLDAIVLVAKSGTQSALVGAREDDGILDSQLKTKIAATTEMPPGPFTGKHVPV